MVKVSPDLESVETGSSNAILKGLKSDEDGKFHINSSINSHLF